MICAGWIRFRASLMAMRRTSWIDQRINDVVAVLWALPWFGVPFFLAAANWRDGGDPPSRQFAAAKKNGTPNHGKAQSTATTSLIRWSIQEVRRIAIRLARKRIQPAHII